MIPAEVRARGRRTRLYSMLIFLLGMLGLSVFHLVTSAPVEVVSE